MFIKRAEGLLHDTSVTNDKKTDTGFDYHGGPTTSNSILTDSFILRTGEESIIHRLGEISLV
jgi:hypothetical protein